MQVIKRDGRVTEFNPERIVKAVSLAMSHTPGGVDIELANKIALNVQKHTYQKHYTLFHKELTSIFRLYMIISQNDLWNIVPFM